MGILRRGGKDGNAWSGLRAPSGAGTAVGEKRGRWIHPARSQSPSQESPTFQRHLEVTQPFLGALRGAGGPFFGTIPSQGAAAHQDPSPKITENRPGQSQSGKSSAWMAFRKVKFIPEQAVEQFPAPFPHRFGLFPVPLQSLDSPGSNYCLQI